MATSNFFSSGSIMDLDLPRIKKNLRDAKSVSVDCWAESVLSLPLGGLATWAKEIKNLNWFDDSIVRTSLTDYCIAYEEHAGAEPFATLANRILELARRSLDGVGDAYPVEDFCFAKHDQVDEDSDVIHRPHVVGVRNRTVKQLRGQEESEKQLKVQWSDILLPVELRSRGGLLESLNAERKERGLNAVDDCGVPIGSPENSKKRREKSSGCSIKIIARCGKGQGKKMSSAEFDPVTSVHKKGEHFPALAVRAASDVLALLSSACGTRLFCLSVTLTDEAISLWYYDASGIIYSSSEVSIIRNFDLFAAIIVGLACCTPEQFGLLPTSAVGPRISNPQEFPPAHLVGSTLTLCSPITKAEVSATLGRPLFSQHRLIGKRTLVYKVNADPMLCGKKLIVKLSYQSLTRREEHTLVTIAQKAKVRHLPEIHRWGDLWRMSDGARSVFFEKSEQQACYEDRVLRAIVYTRYSRIVPLFADNCLLIPVMVDQMLDCLHDLRYKANILHCDISVNNIMYEKRGDYYHFVLIDFDLAIEVDKDGIPSYVSSSKKRTGTLPFVAHELLRDMFHAVVSACEWEPVPHLLCHDLQSLFWVSLWCIMRLFLHGLSREDVVKIINFLRQWEDADSGFLILAECKSTIACCPLSTQHIELPGPTVALRSWLDAWTSVFVQADCARRERSRAAMRVRITGRRPLAAPFDEETIGGTFTRQTLKDALTPCMPFKQTASDTELDRDDMEPTGEQAFRDDGPPMAFQKDMPPRHIRKRARPQGLAVAAENDARARLRPRRKVTYRY